MKHSDTPVKKEPKKIRLKDLIPVDYTDDSWPEDEEGQLAYDYWKRASGVLDEDNLDDVKDIQRDTKIPHAQKTSATGLINSFDWEYAGKVGEDIILSRKDSRDGTSYATVKPNGDWERAKRSELTSIKKSLGEELEEAYDTQISKYELNGELKRVNDRIKFLQNTPKKFSSSPLNVSSELKKLEDLRDSILAMLKEEDILEEVDSEYITEALNMLQRMKRRAIMRKNKSKILAGRRRSQRRRASTSVLQQRAMRAARSALARRLLHKSKGEASYGEKVRVEKMLAARQSTIKNIARRLLSTVRQKERQRFQTHATPPKPIQSVKPNK